MKRMWSRVETGDVRSFLILNVKVYDSLDTALKMVRRSSIKGHNFHPMYFISPNQYILYYLCMIA